ncbi:DUF5693 family protein [Solibacillus sp. FSL W7-1464]|uniref:DUF5693 family protein n=1 Tax=Solibacillus sp. FSL W7-1464 TaxID=2921706 RepID=UPI0030FBC676
MSQSTLVKSTLILTVATLLSKILGSIFRVPLQNIAGDEVLGIFSLVYPVYMVALYLSVAGIPLAISKLIAEANSKNTPQQIHKIYITASILALCFGLFSFTVIFSFSHVLADALGGPSTRFALIIVALTLLVAPYMAVYRGFFQGYGDMRPTAVSQVVEQLIRAVLIIVAAYVLVKMDLSTEVIAGGVMIGSVIGALASLLYLRIKYRRSPYKVVATEKYEPGRDFPDWGRTILKISIPIAIGSVTMALFNFVDSFTATYALKQMGVTAQQEINYLYGLYGRGMTLVQITTVFASSIILPLVPLITTKLVQNDLEGTRNVIEQTYRMTHLITWPAALGLVALTLPLNLALYTNLEGSMMLAIISASAAFTSLTLVSTGVLQGMSAARVAAIIIIGGVLLKIVLNIVLISQFGLEGAAWSTLIVYAVVFIVNTLVILRKMRFSALNGMTVKIILSSIIMALAVGLPTLWLDVASWGRLFALGYALLAIGVGGIIYAALLWGLGALHPDDVKRIPVIGKKLHIKKRESKNSMKIKQSWLWTLIVLLLLAASIGVINRWNVEQGNNVYEVIIPYEEILITSNESGLSVDEVLGQLKEAGLSTVSISPVTLTDLEKQSIVTIFEENELAAQLYFTPYRNSVDVKNKGYYISVPEDAYYQRFITDIIDVEEVTFGDQPFYFLPSSDEFYDDQTPLGYDEQTLAAINRHELSHVFRVTNAVMDEVNGALVNQLVDLKTDSTAGLLGLGTEALGFGQVSQPKFVQKLDDAGYYFYLIEGSQLKGELPMARQHQYNAVRLISIDVNKNSKYASLQMSLDASVRAIKERNIRSIFYHIKTTGDSTENLELAVDYLQEVHERMPASFAAGAPMPFDKIDVPSWSKLLLFLAGVVFTYLMVGLTSCRPLQYVAAVVMLALAAGYFVLDRLVFVQAFALVIAVLTPIYAVMSSKKGSNSLVKIAALYLKAVAISFVGIFIVVGLLNGNGFITGFEAFRGVKLVYIIPIAGVVVLVIMSMYRITASGYKHALSRSVKIMNTEVRYWHLILFVVVAAIGLFYISRTGNAGTASALELSIRQWLEDTLYVRPRTKEFLIGFPIFVVALYAMSVNRKLGHILLVPAVIGFLSVMNTFTHLHIPLSASLLRTAYSVILGFVIGVIFIYVFKVIYKYIIKWIARWS